MGIALDDRFRDADAGGCRKDDVVMGIGENHRAAPHNSPRSRCPLEICLMRAANEP